MIEFLYPALFLSIILILIHTYFGFEIIKRGVIFTDLAIGQSSALGASVALILFSGEYLYITSLSFALFSAVVIAFISKDREFAEAFIGLLYAFSLSSIFLILSNSPDGAEIFLKLLATDILFVDISEVFKVGVLYCILGAFLYFFINRLEGFRRDLLFFITFAITVTSSVKLAGVLIVFTLLIAPAFIALILNKNIIFAYTLGILIVSIAIFMSYNFDLPTGYTIVALFSFSAIFTFLIKKLVLYRCINNI